MVLLMKKVGYRGFSSRNTPCQADYGHQVNQTLAVQGRDFARERSHATLSHGMYTCYAMQSGSKL